MGDSYDNNPKYLITTKINIMKVIKIDATNSVLIKSGNIKVWVDVYTEGEELFADWNKYIFHLNNPEDLEIRSFQDKPENFEAASSLAIEFYEANLRKIEKVYYEQDNIGGSKYTVSFHNGTSTHKDGSPFYDIKIFSNKKERNNFIKELQNKNYKKR